MNTGVITSFNHECYGILKTDEGKVIFVYNALLDEKVTYKVISNKKKFSKAVTLEVLEKSQHRVDPKCKFFSICGGCSLQHISQDYQIELKQKILLEQLQHFGKVEPKNILDPIIGPCFGYRHKARLSVKYVIKKQKLLIGFHEKHKGYIADMEQCEILHPKVGYCLLKLRELVAALTVCQSIPQIEVAIGDMDCALIFRHLEPIPEDDQAKLQNFAKENDMHIYLQPKGLDSIHKIWPNDNKERLSYSIPAYDLKMYFHPTDFTQINPVINRKLISHAINLLKLDKANDIVLDLFCGLGNFSLPIAKNVKNVIGVEGSEQMVQRANENATLNNIRNAEFFSADLTSNCQDSTWMKQKFNKVLLDPPRTGALQIIHQIAKLKSNIEAIVYVSCNPATLARDAGILVIEYGYTLQSVNVMDMFPGTKHVEAIALFVK